jgi:hypothetical protein
VQFSGQLVYILSPHLTLPDKDRGTNAILDPAHTLLNHLPVDCVLGALCQSQEYRNATVDAEEKRELVCQAEEGGSDVDDEGDNDVAVRDVQT